MSGHSEGRIPFTVLIVEDDADQAATLAAYLRSATDYRVETAPDAESAFASAQRNPPDVVICDIGLPTLDGMAVARQLAHSLPKRPLFLALTGFGDLADELFQSGFQHYYVKPADPIVLETVIRLHESRQRAGWSN